MGLCVILNGFIHLFVSAIKRSAMQEKKIQEIRCYITFLVEHKVGFPFIITYVTQGVNRLRFFFEAKETNVIILI